MPQRPQLGSAVAPVVQVPQALTPVPVAYVPAPQVLHVGKPGEEA